MADIPDAQPERLPQADDALHAQDDANATDLLSLLDPEARSFAPSANAHEKVISALCYDDAEPPEEEYMPAAE